jgi:hypothetical protein
MAEKQNLQVSPNFWFHISQYGNKVYKRTNMGWAIFLLFFFEVVIMETENK